MHHKYHTKAIVLARTSVGEDSASVALLTEDLGLVRARAQGVRKHGARLAPALQTLSETGVSLVRGKEYWRVTGAILERNRFETLSVSARSRAGRIVSLMLRLVHGELPDAELYRILERFLTTLEEVPEDVHDTAECIVAIELLRALGLDAGTVPVSIHEGMYDANELMQASIDRRALIARINKGIAASGL